MKPYETIEHTLVADSLMEIRRYLQDLHAEIVTRYGKGSKPQKRVAYLIAALDRLRSTMQAELFREAGVTGPNPKLARIYHPPVRQAGGPSEGVQA